METRKEYIAQGLVYGKCWGGCEGSYRAKVLRGNSRDEILEEAKKGLKNGTLDYGMGFEKLVGAILDIKEITFRLIEGKEYSHEDHDTVIVGDLSDSQAQHLIDEIAFQ